MENLFFWGVDSSPPPFILFLLLWLLDDFCGLDVENLFEFLDEFLGVALLCCFLCVL